MLLRERERERENVLRDALCLVQREHIQFGCLTKLVSLLGECYYGRPQHERQSVNEGKGVPRPVTIEAASGKV